MAAAENYNISELSPPAHAWPKVCGHLHPRSVVDFKRGCCFMNVHSDPDDVLVTFAFLILSAYETASVVDTGSDWSLEQYNVCRINTKSKFKLFKVSVGWNRRTVSASLRRTRCSASGMNQKLMPRIKKDQTFSTRVFNSIWQSLTLPSHNDRAQKQSGRPDQVQTLVLMFSWLN